MRQTISVKFFARKDRATTGGQVPVFMRVGMDRKRVNIATKIYIDTASWSMQDGSLTSNTKEAQKINRLLDGFKMKAFDYQRSL